MCFALLDICIYNVVLTIIIAHGSGVMDEILQAQLISGLRRTLPEDLECGSCPVLKTLPTLDEETQQ